MAIFILKQEDNIEKSILPGEIEWNHFFFNFVAKISWQPYHNPSIAYAIDSDCQGLSSKLHSLYFFPGDPVFLQ